MISGYSPTGYIAAYQYKDGGGASKLPVVTWSHLGVALVFDTTGNLRPAHTVWEYGQFKGVWPLDAQEVNGAVAAH